MKRGASNGLMSAPKKRSGTQTFKLDYSKLHPGIVASKKGPTFAHCQLCTSDFTISHSGEWDIKRHVETESHKRRRTTSAANPSISSFFGKGKEEDHSVIKAEAVMTELLVKMNVPMSFSSEFTKAVKVAFPDSNIAQKYACSRTKATSITMEMAHQIKKEIVEAMINGPFSIATDGSNDAKEKQFPIVVSTVGGDGVQVALLAVPTLQEAATGENIFEVVKNEVESRGVPWTNCLSFGTDSAAVMIGCKKGVFTRLKELNPAIHLAQCPCHLIHHAAEEGVSSFDFSLDEILTDIYYYLLHSSKRQQALEVFQKMEGVEHLKILRHVSTRWLSIGRTVSRILENWAALKSFFKEEKRTVRKEHARLTRLAQSFSLGPLGNCTSTF